MHHASGGRGRPVSRIVWTLFVLSWNGAAPATGQSTTAAVLGRWGLQASDVASLGSGQAVSRTLDSGGDPTLISVLAVAPVSADSSRFIERFRGLDAVRHSALSLGRLSVPPTADDFRTLVLPDADRSDLETCLVGKCRVKLPESWLAPLRDAMPPEKDSTFRSLLRERGQMFQERGADALPPYVDRAQPASVAAALAGLDQRFQALGLSVTGADSARAVAYWMVEDVGSRPVISLEGLTEASAAESAIMAAVQSSRFYSTHYFVAARVVHALLQPLDGGQPLLARVAMYRLDSPLSGFERGWVESKLRSLAEAVTSGEGAALRVGGL
ncbi:MAG: hypothetical protein R3E10_15075 [Gemmatimonadota bacterium]